MTPKLSMNGCPMFGLSDMFGDLMRDSFYWFMDNKKNPTPRFFIFKEDNREKIEHGQLSDIFQIFMRMLFRVNR